MSKHSPCLCVFNYKKEMTAFLVQRWREIAEDAIAQKGFFTAALSGGTSPVEFYRGLAKLKDNFPWDKTHIFLVDEHFVPFSHSDSNYGMMRTLFLHDVKIPEGNIHAIMTDEPSPSKAARRYEDELKRFFGLAEREIPEFDFVSLGIGEDGHTASLFPGGPEVHEKVRLAIAVEHRGVQHKRISLTLPVINNAKNVIFIAMGKQKTEILRRVIEDREETLPSSKVEPAEGSLLFVLDSDAASPIFRKDKPPRTGNPFN